MNRSKIEIPEEMANAWRRHERKWKRNRYVYAVVSRRSRGLSIGLNLNPGKICNFDCVYCQVSRKVPAAAHRIHLARLTDELETILRAEKDGSLYEETPFNVMTPAERGVRDIAFSGDGEPTAFRHFEAALRIAAEARARFGLQSAKLVLLTNASFLHRRSVREALAVLDENNGEIWAKLDAGTEEYFREVNRTRVPLARILENILGAARVRPLVIQTLWLRLRGDAPSDHEIEAYCGRLNAMISAGGQFKTIQFHTIARTPAESYVSPLSEDEVDRIASIARQRIAVPVEVYYSG